MSALFEPISVGGATLSNRVVLAPLTRFRNDDDHAPNADLAPEYYAERAIVPGTLLIAEATDSSVALGGYANTPGLYSAGQVAAWKKVTDAVHAKGGVIFVQLWALGRVNPGNIVSRVISASTVQENPYPVPEEMSLDDIAAVESDFVAAAKNAIAAGFDGVEVHGAHGYLVDQFIQDVSNKRTDAYGGSVENRARFALEIVDKVAAAIGEDKTAIRLSPFSQFQSMKMDDPFPTFSYIVSTLEKTHPKLAYIHFVEPRVSGGSDRTAAANETTDVYHALWSGPWIAAGGFTPESAKAYADSHPNSLVAFGRAFIPNPDLVARIKEGLPLVPYDRDTFYTAKAKEGYLGYAFAPELKGKYY
ncbi:uncharacterized protein V1518DRAFT_420461 [Limtongia smithiae]|uniref:uncharacterized protein n=1 Tax=Limtongia smithiae TaxID=1125753 RepID=UPI0034CE98F8